MKYLMLIVLAAGIAAGCSTQPRYQVVVAEGMSEGSSSPTVIMVDTHDGRLVLIPISAGSGGASSFDEIYNEFQQKNRDAMKP